jgi:5-methylcytosine-specific restriction protein A
MPTRAMRICSQPGCCVLTHEARCSQHRRAGWATSRGKSREQRGYGYQHRKLREQVAAEEPACICCGSADPIWHLDHITPLAHGGTTERTNVQRLCLRCSKAKTATEDRA